jgi:cytochrome o ubiquinol oxidase subunit 2
VNKKLKIIISALVALILLTIIAGYFKQADLQVLEPAGTIGAQQRDLIYFALGLSLIVVIPVYVMLFLFAWRYREGNKKRAKYSPEFSGSRTLETIWWLIPTILIIILSVVAWRSSHQLDPYRPLASKARPLTVQVVAMDWKWLFIYPEQNIASVNFLAFPKDTPLDLRITSDAPMNSFWLPKLGGQVYAMPGMTTRLHLIADREGTFRGSSANISGKDFARMTFQARSTSAADYAAWVNKIRSSGANARLDVAEYQRLARPGTSGVKYYSSVKEGLFEAQVLKYMVPTTTDGHSYHFMPSVHLDDHEHGGSH